MKKIYILQMYSQTIPSKFIRMITNYQYTHVAISLDKSCDKIYSFGRKKINTILNGGFTIESKTSEFYTKFSETICKIFEIEVTEEQYEIIKNIISEMEENEEKYKYDLLGIVIRFFRIPITFENKYVCSYFVAELLEKAKIHKFTKRTCFIKPKDFEEIKEMNKIYEGMYQKYQN